MKVDPSYRTFWRRFWAGFVDALVFAPLMALDSWLAHRGTSLGIFAVWFVCTSAAFPVYAIYMHGRFGQTIGKRLLGVKVVALSGAPLTMAQALRREAINLPFGAWSIIGGVVLILHGGNPYDTGAPVKYGPPAGLESGLFWLELLSTLASSKRRALHDFVAGSVVIRYVETRSAELVPVDSRPLQPGEFACSECGNAVRLGASHCRACDQSFTYRNGVPTASNSA